MSTPAVTPDAPAASSLETFETEHSQVISPDKHYRQTGELEKPAPKKEEKAPAADSAAASAAASEIAAASEAASKPQKKTPQSSESRWAKLARQNRELREENARLKTSSPGQQQQQTQQQQREQQASQPAAEAQRQPETKTKGRPEPKIDDVDPKTQKPKYANFQEWQSDLRKWDREEAIREFQELSSKTERERQQQTADQQIQKVYDERIAKGRENHADYDDVMTKALALKNEHGQDAFFFTPRSHIDNFFLDSEIGQDVMYEIAKNFDQYKHIFARDAKGQYLMAPIRQVRELAKIEIRLAGAGNRGGNAQQRPNAGGNRPSARPQSQAPRPPHQTSGQGAVSKDTVEEAIETGDFSSYRAELNRRELERRKKGN